MSDNTEKAIDGFARAVNECDRLRAELDRLREGVQSLAEQWRQEGYDKAAEALQDVIDRALLVEGGD